MKRGTLEHFKTIRLATLLSTPERPCDEADALGIVEAMCNHFAPRSAPQGNIGRCRNPEIAKGCGSTRDADAVVAALVGAGWLDEHPEYRLLIHDWKDHADESVRKWLLRNKLPWLTMSGPCRVTVRKPSRRRLDAVRPPRAGNGNGKGSLVSSASEELGGVRGEPFVDFWAAYPKKIAKADARAAWKKHRLDDQAEVIAAGLAKWCAYWEGRDQQYTPNAATWLNDERWSAEPPKPAPTKQERQLAGLQSYARRPS